MSDHAGGVQLTVPEAEFTSCYGRPILNPPTWQARDIAGCFLLGGLAGAGSVLTAGAGLTGRTGMARAPKVSSLVSIARSAAALGPAVASYTAVPAADTAVPGRHEGYRELPYPFIGSAAVAAGGMALIASPVAENAPARRGSARCGGRAGRGTARPPQP